MNSWLLRALNTKAKAWPYYAHDRVKQRQSIKDMFDMIRDAMATNDAYVLKGRGDNALHYQKGGSGTLEGGGSWSYGLCTYSGFGDHEIEIFKRLGLPVIDCFTADFGKLAKAVIGGPMVAVGSQKVTEYQSSLGYRPLREVAAAYKAAGCTVYNLELE